MIAYQVLIAATLLISIEGALRIADSVRNDLSKPQPWFIYAADVGWDRRPNFNDADDCGMDRTFDERGFVASEAARLKEEKRDQLRVVFLGDSSTYGSCAETEYAFVSVAGGLVPQAQVINLGVNGYTSYQGYKALLKYGKLLSPDLIFISFNFNDRRFVLQPEMADSDRLFKRLSYASMFNTAADVSYIVRAARGLSKWLAGEGEGTDEARTIGDMEVANVKLDKVRARVEPEEYRSNLTKMVQWAKANGSSVAFILLGDNPNQTDDLREGLKFLSENDYEQAIAAFTTAKDGEDVWYSALARLRLSRIYKQQGKLQEAEDILVMDNAVSGLTGGYPIHLDTDYHQIMREIASEHGVTIVDAASELSKVPDAFWDHCHFDESGHEIVGRLVADAIRSIGAARTAGLK